MSLKEYRKKRNFAATKEPKGEIKSKKSKKLIFVIHEHHATHLHYDLRLEMKGVLKSWAVPKTPPTEKGIKRLAIEVEDHPIEYAKFHGIISEGYGKGVVKIWDRGTYSPEDMENKKFVFNLHGKKMKGKFCLLKTNFSKNSWLFFKIK